MTTAQKEAVSTKKLIDAISKGKGKLLEELLENGGDVNARNAVDNTLLHLACSDKTYKAMILEDLNSLNEDEEEKDEKQKKIVELLLEKGADINARNADRQTPLMLAILSADFIPIIDILLTKDVDIGAKDKDGFTALHYAALKDDTEYIEKLLEKGGNINTQAGDGTTPFMVALLKNNTAVMKVIEKTPGFDINIADKNGTTALMHAVMEKKDIKPLLDAGADMAIYNKEGKTAIMIADNRFNTEAEDVLKEYGSPIISSDDYEKIMGINRLKKKLRNRNANWFTEQGSLSFLDIEELITLAIYTYAGDKYIVNFLRGIDELNWYKNPRFIALFGEVLKEDSIVPYQKIVYEYFKKLYGVIEKFPARRSETKVYRGVKTHYLGDDAINIPYITSFTSTTLEKEVAESFSNTNIYTFLLHPECKYAEVFTISSYPDEKELLLNPYQKINFVKREQIEKEGGVLQIIRTYVILPGDIEYPKEFDAFMEWKDKINSGTMKGGRVNTLRQTRKTVKLLKKSKGMKSATRKTRSKKRVLSEEFRERMDEPIEVSGKRVITEKEKRMVQEVLSLSKIRV